ncbi:MAG: hypothetical protein AB8B66_05185 [Rickettsiaceae bacterium]
MKKHKLDKEDKKISEIRSGAGDIGAGSEGSDTLDVVAASDTIHNCKYV